MAGGTHRVFALFFAICLLAAACGSGEGGDAAGTSSEAETLEEFFGGPGDDPEAQTAEEERWRQREREMQEKIAECMAAEGFEYTPFVFEESVSFAPPAEEEELSENEWKLKYGYGMFAEMLLWEDEGQEHFGEEMEDPNWEYMDTLSESERMAYEKALWGDWEAFDDEREFDEEGNEIWVEPDWSEIGGCQNIVQQEYYGDRDEAFAELDKELQPAWAQFELWINTDPKVVELRRAWSSCMAEKGYDFESEEDISEHLEQLSEDLWSQQEEPPPDWEPTEEEIEAMGPWGPGIDEADIRALADEELAIAAADVECAGDMFDVMEEIRKEYEAKFIEQYRELLEKQRDLVQDF